MTNMLIQKFPDVKLVQRKIFADERGSFSEIHRALDDLAFVQDNFSISKKGTIRGMHFQSVPGQVKFVTPLVGVIYDVFVDIRQGSPTFGQWGACELDASRGDQLLIPAYFAHGFAVLSEQAHVLYKVSAFYNAETEKGFHYDDPHVGIEWPVDEPSLSERDINAPSFEELFKPNR